MKLDAYVRVSSSGQIDAWGLDRQRRAIKKWARLNDATISGWHSDEGASGQLDALDRPGLSAAITSVTNGAVDGIVVADLDRFARSVMVQESALVTIWRAGGKVFTATDGEVASDESDDASRIALRQMLAVFAEFERRTLVRRLRQGREAKAAAGGKATGAYPFGWEGGGSGRARDAVPCAAETPTVRRILELRAAGLSYRGIAAVLDDECLPPRGRGKWQPASVRAVCLRA